MRKLFIVIFLLSCLTAFNSCDNGTRTLRNETTVDVIWTSVEICADKWMKCSDADGLNTYYKYSIGINGLNMNVLKGGLVQCYLYNGDSQTPLPVVRHYENLHGQYWTRTIDYEFYHGGVSIYVTDNDFAGDPPGVMYFRLAFTY